LSLRFLVLAFMFNCIRRTAKALSKRFSKTSVWVVKLKNCLSIEVKPRQFIAVDEIYVKIMD